MVSMFVSPVCKKFSPAMRQEHFRDVLIPYKGYQVVFCQKMLFL